LKGTYNLRKLGRPKAGTMVILALAVGGGLACSSMSEAQRNAFATRFLESVRDNTEYYREHWLDRDAMQAEAARSSKAGAGRLARTNATSRLVTARRLCST